MNVMNVVNAGMNMGMFAMDGDPPISQLANELISQCSDLAHVPIGLKANWYMG
jgi:hypothetical protein